MLEVSKLYFGYPTAYVDTSNNTIARPSLTACFQLMDTFNWTCASRQVVSFLHGVTNLSDEYMHEFRYNETFRATHVELMRFSARSSKNFQSFITNDLMWNVDESEMFAHTGISGPLVEGGREIFFFKKSSLSSLKK